MKKLFVALAITLLPSAVAAQDLTDVKCIVNPKAAVKAETAVEFNGGKVYFCCNNCARKFQEDNEAFVAMANHQLFLTGQIRQKACPVTGRPVADGVSSDVGGVNVGLCCKSCKAKVDGATDIGAKATIVFSAAAFEKGFALAPAQPDLSKVMCIMMPDHAVDAKAFVEYRDSKLWFCCDHCVEGFAKDPAKYSANANMQLVQTGQYVQTACPISGQPLADGMKVKIGELEVGTCCADCLGKIRSAADDAARTELVFGDKSFEKAFSAVKKDK